MRRWRYLLAVPLTLWVLGAVIGEPKNAHAATTRVWTGAVDGVWSTAGNWSPSGPPVDGDSVVIGPVADGKTLNNNRPAGLLLESLTISASVTIVGNQLRINSQIIVAGPYNNATLDLPIALNSDIDVSLATGVRLFMRDRLSPDGTIALQTNGHRLTKIGGDDMEFNGDITGSGEVRNYSGYLTLSVPVTFSGTLSADSGATTLLTYYLFRPTLTCGQAPNARFVLTSATLRIACVSSIGSLSGTGTLDLGSINSRLTIAGAGSGPVFTGNVTGAAPSNITCCSAGSQTFRGGSSYSGYFNVGGGALVLDGASFPPAALFTVQGAGTSRPTLAGYGSFGETILTTSALALTAINGKFGLARFPGLQFAPDVLVNFELNGPTPGLGFTQILMSGQIVIDHASLKLDFGGYQPPAGQSFTLVYGATALLDTFKNVTNGQDLLEGATFTVSGPVAMQFKITYKGGAGNDVVITRLAAPATPAPSPSPSQTPSPTVSPTPSPTPAPGSRPNKRYLPMVASES